MTPRKEVLADGIEVWLGDCREVMPSIAKVDCVITDAPYLVSKGGFSSNLQLEGGWTCCVEQGRYGHHARKPTLLYACKCVLPELRWGHSEMRLDPQIVARIGIDRAKRRGEVAAKGGGIDSAPRIGTPPEFRDLLISIASTVRPL